MSAIQTGIGARPAATKVAFDPTTDIPKSDVWEAIKYVYDTLYALIAALTASLAAVVVTVTAAQFSADEARAIAQSARGLAREVQRARQHDNAQAIMHAQVFN